MNPESTRMPGNPSVLFVAAGSIPPSVVRWTLEKFAGRSVTFLALDSKQDRHALPTDWNYLTLSDLGSQGELRRDYLQYLEAIPEKPIRKSDTLNRLFRRRDGYSLWWTDVGVRRSPTQGMFLKIKAVWMVTRAIAKTGPGDVVIHTANPRDAAILFSASKPVPNVHFSPDSALPAPLPMVEIQRWFTESVSYLRQFIRHRIQRYRAMEKPYPETQPERKPIVVMSTLHPRHVHLEADVPVAWYWDHLSAAMTTEIPSVAIRYLMDLEVPDAWPLKFDFQYLLKDAPKLASNPTLIPRWRGHVNRWSWLRTRWHQSRLLRRYYRLEGQPSFRSIFRFLDVDLSPEWIVELRHSISMAIWWESEVDAAASILRKCGNVRVVLVNQEFELPGMILIAACRRLGVKSIGVQHGTFYPLHTIYTPPESQVRSTPLPDYLAVYGSYHEEVVSQNGHYPLDRIWKCAGSRFDSLVNHPADRKACRQRLGVPEEPFLILITTQRYAWFPDAVRAVLATAPADCLVCIKKFNEDTVDYEEVIRANSRKSTRVFTEQFADLLGACDILISGSSTTILEATLAGKPTVCLNFSSEPNQYPYVEEGVSFSVRRTEEMEAVLQQLRFFRPDETWHERRMRFLNRHLGPAAVGQAAQEFTARLGEIVLRK